MLNVLIIIFLLTVTGCSNPYLYEKFRLDARNQCIKEPPSTQDECIKRTNKSYEEYERERKVVLEPHN